MGWEETMFALFDDLEQQAEGCTWPTGTPTSPT